MRSILVLGKACLKNLYGSFFKLFWGAFLLLSSVYLLLVFMPYTYVALVKAPPFGWVLWFAGHYPLLYWMAWLAGVLAYRGRRGRWARNMLLGAQAVAGFFLPRFMDNPQCDGRAYAWSVATLLLIAGIAATASVIPDDTGPAGASSHSSLDYSTALVVGAMFALLATGGEALAHGLGSETHLARVETAAWSVAAHVLIALAAVSALNLISLAAFRTQHPRVVRAWLCGSVLAAGLWFGLARFLQNSLDLHGWRAELYSASFAAALTLLGFSVVAPYQGISRTAPKNSPGFRKFGVVALGGILAIATLALPSLIGGSDWNGFLQSVFALGCWLAFGICAYTLRPPRGKYSVVAILATLVVAGLTYKTLQATEIFWAKALGSTDDDVSRALDSYAAQDASFNLARQLLGSAPASDCGDLCRILRAYTNIRDAQVRSDMTLVPELKAASGGRPNVFMFVIDSLRPDYLGAYNSKVDFSPNLDAFARDSIVVHNVFTQYAGTSLSEPAIWSGMELLHSHYMQPFSRVNSLEKLAAVDGYQLVVSWDEVLRQVLAPQDDLVKLDTDKHLWNELEVCSTIQQTERLLDSANDNDNANAAAPRPIFFYTQPKNVHQFARNNLPSLRATHWPARPGFETRIAYEVHQVDECMGGFFAYLKRQNLYDNSIIILASDHGDATGEFGRSSHSLSIYPEVMRVPLLIHLPAKMRSGLVYDDRRISALTDIAPTLYYLFGHRPIRANPLFGHPLLAESQAELQSYRRDQLFLASDERAVYGVLAENGRYFYATYDSPPQSYLYDLANDPNGVRNVLTPALKKYYDAQVVEHLQAVADFYGYKPKFWTLVAAAGN